MAIGRTPGRAGWEQTRRGEGYSIPSSRLLKQVHNRHAVSRTRRPRGLCGSEAPPAMRAARGMGRVCKEVGLIRLNCELFAGRSICRDRIRLHAISSSGGLPLPFYTLTKASVSRVPGSGVRGRGSGERETTASSLAGKEESSRKEDNSGQGKDGPAGVVAQGGNGR